MSCKASDSFSCLRSGGDLTYEHSNISGMSSVHMSDMNVTQCCSRLEVTDHTERGLSIRQNLIKMCQRARRSRSLKSSRYPGAQATLASQAIVIAIHHSDGALQTQSTKILPRTGIYSAYDGDLTTDLLAFPRLKRLISSGACLQLDRRLLNYSQSDESSVIAHAGDCS